MPGDKATCLPYIMLFLSFFFFLFFFVLHTAMSFGPITGENMVNTLFTIV